MAKKKNKRAENPQPETTPKKKKAADNQSSQKVIFVALVAFCIGFLSGVGLTVYKTESGSTSGAVAGVPATPATPAVRNDTAQMELALEMEAQRDPQNVGAWIRLGNAYFDSGRHEKSVEAYTKALAIDPNNANVLTDLGVMYRRSGRPKKAVESFERAIAVDPKHETAWFNKGIVLLHDLNDGEGAIKSWEELVSVNPVAMTPTGQSVDEMVTRMKKQAGMQ